MIDLTTYKHDYYEIVWFDGEKLEIKKPTQSLLLEILALDNINNPEEQLKAFNKVLTKILNNNINQKVFNEKEIEELDYTLVEMILTDYIESVYGELGE